MLLTLQLASFDVGHGFQCDDGCDIPDDFVNDDWCDCLGCDDETNWTCDTCSSNGCSDGCQEAQPCFNVTLNIFGNLTYTCSDGCTIPSFFVNDSYCDCSDCEDELEFTCSTCFEGCPEPDVCIFDVTWDGDIYFWYCLAVYEDSFDGFLLDCKMGWQEGILLALDGFLLFISLSAVTYFTYKMFHKKNKHKLQVKLKVLVTICNIVYLLCLALNIQKTYLSFMAVGCYLYLYYWENTFTIVFDITQMIWRRLFIFAFIIVYMTFAIRLENALKNSMFESKKLNYYLRFSYILLIIVWIWGMIWTFFLFSQYWNGDKNTYDIHDTALIDYNFLTNDWIVISSTISLEICCLFSLIGMILFIYKFKQVVVCVAGQFDNGAGKKPSQFFESIISKTTLLGILALVSTLTVVIVEWTWKMDFYTQQIFGVILSIDSMINIFCLNLNYDHSKSMYNKCNCGKMEKTIKLCVLCPTCTVAKMTRLSIHQTTISSETDTANDD